MIGLSVAVGRFVEALFWAILRVAGGIAAIAIGVALAAIVLWIVARRFWAARR